METREFPIKLPGGYETLEIITDGFTENLNWYEYLVFGAVLIASLGIGVFYGCFGSKNKTNEEFLMAGRSMSILPVTMSLVCSFVSAVTLLGNPVEVYYYGQQYTMIAFAFIPMTFALAYLYVPVYFELQLSSAYQYFEWRFSRGVRLMCSIFAMIHLTFYMPITVLGPSLAIDQVAGFDYRISSALIFLVCIGYSSLGGLKAVLWTDALQAFVMFGALLSLVICGTIEVGGLASAWEKTANTDRNIFFIVDPDPRYRHTFWTATVGGFLLWLPLFGATQAQIQRYNSVPTLRESRQCLFFNMFGMMLVIVLCSWLGLLIYAQYFDCDPVKAELVSSADQLLPLFVMDALRDYPVLPGLLVAGITCGSLSTVSSALNSFAGLITEDFIKLIKPGWDDVKLGYASKTISTVAGLVAFGLVFIVREINKTINISPFSTLIHGSLIGPILGAFTLGMFFPWVSNVGMILGMITSILLSGFVGLGNIIVGRQDKLPNLRLDLTLRGCPCSNGTAAFDRTQCQSFLEPEDLHLLDMKYDENWKDFGDPNFFMKVWSTSYIWQPGIGELTTIIFGLLYSFIIIGLSKKRQKVHVKLLSKPFMRMWNAIFGPERMKDWVDYDPKVKFGKENDEPVVVKDKDDFQMESIPKAKFVKDSPYAYG